MEKLLSETLSAVQVFGIAGYREERIDFGSPLLNRTDFPLATLLRPHSDPGIGAYALAGRTNS